MSRLVGTAVTASAYVGQTARRCRFSKVGRDRGRSVVAWADALASLRGTQTASTHLLAGGGLIAPGRGQAGCTRCESVSDVLHYTHSIRDPDDTRVPRMLPICNGVSPRSA